MISIFLVLIYLLFIKCDNLSFQEILFYKIVQKTKNVVVSPFSIYQILSLVSNGAYGETQKEILKVLIPYKNIDNETQNTVNLNMIDNLNKISQNKTKNEYKVITLLNANAIFVNKLFPILQTFSLICKKHKSESLNLESVEQVNDWINEKQMEKFQIFYQITINWSLYP